MTYQLRPLLTYYLFADDTTIYKSDYDIDHLTPTLNQELNKQAIFEYQKIATLKHNV